MKKSAYYIYVITITGLLKIQITADVLLQSGTMSSFQIKEKFSQTFLIRISTCSFFVFFSLLTPKQDWVAHKYELDLKVDLATKTQVYISKQNEMILGFCYWVTMTLTKACQLSGSRILLVENYSESYFIITF